MQARKAAGWSGCAPFPRNGKIFCQVTITQVVIDGGYAEAAVNFGAEDKELFVFALNVFEELGLISDAGGRYEVNRGVRTDLRNSAAYNVWTELKNGG